MRSIAVRQGFARAAAVAVSAALVAACSPKPTSTGPSGSGALGSALPSQLTGLEAGALLLSDGTATVTVGSKKIVFTTTVADAAWSPDGSRIAFVDGDGNIATARPDGSGLLTLTRGRSGIKRSHPAWFGSEILFTETDSSGKSLQWRVRSNGSATAGESGQSPADTGQGGAGDPGTDSNLSTSAATGKGKELAFQRTGSAGPEVWVADLNQRSPFQTKVANGSQPALSSDGMKVAYVANGQINVIDATVDGAKPKQITTSVSSPTHLAWSPDGSKITFETASDVETVAADGSTAPKLVSATPAAPTYLGPARDRVARLVGKDSIAAAVAASQMRYPRSDGVISPSNTTVATQVLLTGTGNFSAILAGSQLVDNGPLLLTGATSLDPRTAAEIKRVLGPSDSYRQPTVNILGDTDTVSANVESAVHALGYPTHRTVAKDPFTTAVTVNGKPSFASTVLVVDQSDVASYASAISDLGANSQQTVLLSNGYALPDPVRTFLQGVSPGIAVYALGPKAAQAVSGVVNATTLGGGSSSPTAGLLNTFGGYLDSVVVVNASNPGDLLAAIGLARGYGAMILAVDPKSQLDPNVATWLQNSSAGINSIMVVDSTNSIGADLTNALGALVCGPLGFSATITNPVAPPLS